MASLSVNEITPKHPVPLSSPVPTPEDRPPWEHLFHHKFLTINFAGYLIMGKDWQTRVKELMEKSNRVSLISGREGETEERFKELVDEFDEELVGSTNTLKRFACVIGTDLGKGREEFLTNKCENDILTEIRRYKSIHIPKDTIVSMQEPSDTPIEVKPHKYQSVIPITEAVDNDSYKLAIEEETERRVREEMGLGFRIMFGRRDHHLVSSLVSALWSMQGAGNIRMAFVPREQLLSVDMEDRKARELTLQLHPNKPVYKRRDRDEIRGFEETFVDALPWCKVPGGRNLSAVITNELFEEISGIVPDVMWVENKWEMGERKRLYRTERKKDKETVPLKVTDSRVQVNHFLPILKETTGFKGYIREEKFYEGLRGLLYLIQVSHVDDTCPSDSATHLERIVLEELEHRKVERKARRDKRKMEEKEKAKTKT